MDKGRIRDKNGRFLGLKKSSRQVEHTNSEEMSGDKRPRIADGTQDLSKIPSPSTSPRRKKNLSDDTASWRSSPNFSTDFYPQYMRKSHSPASKSSPVSRSNHSTSRDNGESSLGSSSSQQAKAGHSNHSTSTSFIAPQGESTESVLGSSHHDKSDSASISDYHPYSRDSRSSRSYNYEAACHYDTTPQSMERNSQINSNHNSDVQTFDSFPNGRTNQNSVRCLTNPKGQFINTADLEDIMSRAMSKVMVQLQTITTDLKQVPALKATTAKLDREMIQVRQDCYGIKESVQEVRQKGKKTFLNMKL